jgi:hypothetical protein
MSEVKVTRAHREATWRVFAEYPQDGPGPVDQAWIDGEPVRGLRTGVSRCAQAIAEAEQRGYAKCQADVGEWLRFEAARWAHTHKLLVDNGSTNIDPEYAINADTLVSYAEAAAAGSHIGASDSVPSGREGG